MCANVYVSVHICALTQKCRCVIWRTRPLPFFILLYIDTHSTRLSSVKLSVKLILKIFYEIHTILIVMEYPGSYYPQ